jgi:hypothetical protein
MSDSAKRGDAAQAVPSPGSVGLATGAGTPEIVPKTQSGASKSVKVGPSGSGDKAGDRKASLDTSAQDAGSSEPAAEGATPRRWFGTK